MAKREMVIGTCAILLVLVVCLAIADDFKTKPNFVIFLADDMGFADLQYYGNPLSQTPNINRITRNGLKFTQFYSASSVGSPSRAALLTGRYPVRSGVWGHTSSVFNQGITGGLPHKEITIPEMLSKQGYQSAHIGKWHLGVGYNREYLPLQHGFDRYFGVPHSHSDCPCETCFYPDDPCDYDQCIDWHAPCQLMYGNRIIEQPVDLTQLSERQARAARSWIQEYSCSKTPFFLFYSFLHTHIPQFSGERFRNMTIGGQYTDSLAEIDWQVGEVLNELQKQGLSEDTLVIFTSDNGADLAQDFNGGFSGPMRCGKGSTFEGGHRVPTIMYWPGHVRSGISKQLLSHLDIWPTLKSLSGSLPDEFGDLILDGIDFSNVLFSHRQSKRKSMLFYPMNPNPSTGAIGLRDVKYKIQKKDCSEVCDNNNGEFFCTSKNSYLLYDLLLDPEERNEIANQTEFETILEVMSEKMNQLSNEIEFGESVLMDYDESVQMCCDAGCEPFPSCCSCESAYSDNLFPLDKPCMDA